MISTQLLTDSKTIARFSHILRSGLLLSLLAGLCIAICAGCGGGAINQVTSGVKTQTTNAAESDTSKTALEPLSAPANLKLVCCQDSITLFWDEIPDSHNIGYQIFRCNETECFDVKQQIDDPHVTSYAFHNLGYGVMYCYAIAGISSNPSQKATSSEIRCGIPEEYWAYIRLSSPANNASVTTASPTFEFAHYDDYYQVDYFDVIVSDKNSNEIMNKRIQAHETDGGVGEYSVAFSSETQLIDGEKYSWRVSGHVTNVNAGYESQNWIFQYQNH